jgi:hypothetical protein
MGNGLSSKRVLANVEGLNHLFAPDIFNQPNGTRDVITFLRAYAFPYLLSHGNNNPRRDRQGSLWFAASVLTPNLRLAQYAHPAKNHARWLKWLL